MRTDECATGRQGQAGEVSGGHCFPQGQAGCVRSEAEEKGVISKWGVSHASSPLAAPRCVPSWVWLHARLHSWYQKGGQGSRGASRQ